MLIDTYYHLDAAEFDADRMEIARRALASGVGTIIIPAVERANFAVVRDLAHAIEGTIYALGIHPLYVERAAQLALAAEFGLPMLLHVRRSQDILLKVPAPPARRHRSCLQW